VDAANGNDSFNGTSSSTAWKTIAKVESVSFNPGDTILFRRGEIWRDRLDVTRSGAPGNPITFGAYGTGDKPLILGSEEVIDGPWTNQGNNLWRKSMDHQTKIVFFDMTHDGIGAGMGYWRDPQSYPPDSKYEWYSTSSYLEVYSEGNPASFYSSIEAERRSNCILVHSNYIELENLDCRGTSWAIIQIDGDYVEISHCDVSFSTFAGIYGNGRRWEPDGADYLDIHDCEVSFTGKRESQSITVGGDHTKIYNNNIHDNYGEGIDVWYGAKDCKIYRNYVDNNDYVSVGIYVDGASDVDIYQNYVTRSSYGISVADEWTTYNVSSIGIYNNICKNNFVGIYIGEDTGADTGEIIRVYNNVVYGSTAIAAVFKSGFSGDVKNNIFYDSQEVLIVEDGSRITLDHNCYYDDGSSSAFINYNGVGYSLAQFSNYKSASGQDSSSIALDPEFKNVANNDFSLNEGSPCIDAGVDVILSEDYTGTPVPQGPKVDIGAYEYSRNIISSPRNLRIVSDN